MSDTINRYQKLASAIYLITGFFSDLEPLKWRLRSLSADLVSNTLRDKLGTTQEILDLFVVAKNAQLISETNYGILVREFSKLAQEVEKPLEIMFPKGELGQTAPASISAPAISTVPSAPTPVSEISAPVSVSKPAAQSTPVVRDNLIPPLSEKKLETKPSLKEFGAVSVKKSGRQSIIIGLLKRKKEIMIKDVSPLISGCSEKTIQRELSEMVSEGVLAKFGEKRWTRYTLARP